MKIPKPVRKLIKKSEGKERKSLSSAKHKMSEKDHSFYKKGIKKSAKNFYKAIEKEKKSPSMDMHAHRRMSK